MQKSKLENLIELMRSSLDDLNIQFSEEDLESISIVVYDSMSHPGRSFHNIHHVFDVAFGLKGLSVIASIFHDIVYYQVDQGFRNLVEPTVFANVENAGDYFVVKKSSDPLILKTHIIFGINAGTSLNIFNGLNEFLSAVIAIDLLKNILSETQLLKLVGLIESTIPFRKDAIDVLETRFRKLNFPQAEIENLCKEAADFSNSDVFNFAEKDTRKFLNNTWNLISETNYSLRRGLDNYSAHDYRLALSKTYSFFKALDPENVFSRYKDYPNEKKWKSINDGAVRNIELGRRYLMVKLVSFGLIEALAMSTGGNGPLSLFMGDIRRRDQKLQRMEDYLGSPGEIKNDVDENLLHLFDSGRSQESSFDMKGSPLSSFIYKAMGEKAIEELFPHLLDFFHGAQDSRSILKLYPKFVLERVVNSCAEISSTRKERLHKVYHSVVH
jgi:hypothetical protein